MTNIQMKEVCPPSYEAACPLTIISGMSLHDLGYDAGLPIIACHAPALRLVRSSSFYVGMVDNYEIVRDAQGAYLSFKLHTTKGICLTTTSWDVPSTQFL